MRPGSAAPRRAPRARSSRPAHSPAGSRRALPRPPAAGGGGGARPASELRGRTRECERGGPGPLLEQAAGGGAVGPAARRGGARRAALRAGLGAVPTPTPTAVHCGGASGGGHELRRRGSVSARAGPPPLPGRCRSPLAGLRGPQGTPSPRPAPAHARPRSHRTAAGCPPILELAGAPELGENALLPGRPAAPAAGRPRAPAPASRMARAPSAPPARAYLQPGTATDTRRGLPALTASRPGTGWTRGAGARWVAVYFGIFFFFWSLGRGRGGRESCTSLMVAALLLHEHRMSSRP